MKQTGPSLRRRLLVALIVTILLVWAAVTLLVYRAAEHEVEEVFDADLARSARTLQTLLLHEVDEEREMSAKVHDVLDELGREGLDRYPRLASILGEYVLDEVKERLELVGAAQEAGHRYGAGLIIVARYADGSIMLRDKAAPEVPLTAPGFVDVEDDGQRWRVYRLTDAATGFTVQVGERHAFREELVRDITRNTLTPLVIALPVLALLILVVVGRVLTPLRHVAMAVTRREPDALDAIDERDAPREISSLVHALNALFVRMQATLERERRFTADAAHELRTPLAAIKTHLQLADACAEDAGARASISQALLGVDRTTHLVGQLLALARADAGQARDMVHQRVDLRAVVMTAVGQFSQRALERDIDLGVDAPAPVYARGEMTALCVLVRNLVDNAVRYTPPGGTVTVSVGGRGDQGWIRVRDDGPGVAAGDRDAIFNRFRRGRDEQSSGIRGSGLGLSIVQRIAQLHAAQIELDEGLNGRGLGVCVLFPAP